MYSSSTSPDWSGSELPGRVQAPYCRFAPGGGVFPIRRPSRSISPASGRIGTLAHAAPRAKGSPVYRPPFSLRGGIEELDMSSAQGGRTKARLADVELSPNHEGRPLHAFRSAKAAGIAAESVRCALGCRVRSVAYKDRDTPRFVVTVTIPDGASVRALERAAAEHYLSAGADTWMEGDIRLDDGAELHLEFVSMTPA